MTRDHAFNLLRRIREEFIAGRFAVTEVLRALNNDLDVSQAAHKGDVHIGELRRCAQNLEVTFILRLFAEFEAILRDFWTTTIRPTRPDMQPLMNAIAARRNMGPDHLAAAQAIREFRNEIIHENLRVLRFTFGDCQHDLGRYLSWFPSEW